MGTLNELLKRVGSCVSDEPSDRLTSVKGYEHDDETSLYLCLGVVAVFSSQISMYKTNVEKKA